MGASWTGLHFARGESSNSNGVGILINKSWNCNIIEYREIIVGRMQLIKLHLSTEIIFFAYLETYIPEKKTMKIIKILHHIKDCIKNCIQKDNNIEESNHSKQQCK